MTHEHYAARSHPEFVALDIGEQMGALILHVEADWHGVEIEISPAGRDHERSHKQVLERSCGGTPAYTAVYDALPEGAYTLWLDDRPLARDVRVRAGEVSELDWRNREAA